MDHLHQQAPLALLVQHDRPRCHPVAEPLGWCAVVHAAHAAPTTANTQTVPRRMNELSELARQGKLTSQEQAELDSYLHVGNLLAVIQSKGRRALQRSSQ